MNTPHLQAALVARRAFLSLLGTLPVAKAALGSAPQDIPPLRKRGKPLMDDVLDEALVLLAPYASSFRGGLSNHGPMTAEALLSMGHKEGVIGWVEQYRKRLEPRPSPSHPVPADTWQEALGKSARVRDWEEWFTNELKEHAWREVLARWVPRLAPGLAAAGLHGVIRAGHAASSLAVRESAERLDELARALGYWAAEYLPLPGAIASGASAPSGKLAPSRALAQVPILPQGQRGPGGLISTEMQALKGFAPFADVIGLVDPAAGEPSFLSDLLGTFAGVFANTRSSSFVFLHAVTGAAAVAELLPYVAAAQRSEVLAYTWQVTAGVFSRYGYASLDAQDRASAGIDHLRRADPACRRLRRRAHHQADRRLQTGVGTQPR